tara:strand:- start:4947 stop:5837 length:891 start_codon:yes stop_codon:yes gene_type:complete
MKPYPIIGSAQFGMPYGITNSSGQVSFDDVIKILNLSYSAGIRFLDTAELYGNSIKILGNYFKSYPHFGVINKFPSQSMGYFCKTDILVWEEKLKASLSQLGIKQIDSYLLHSSNDLKKDGSQFLLDWLISIRERGLVKRIGLSVYDSHELDGINLKNFQLIQLPFSIYDQRFLIDGTIEKIKSFGLSIHARSIYLQGLILTNSSKWPAWVDSDIRKHHEKLENFATSNNCSLLELCLAFIQQHIFLEGYVVGICNLTQLKELILCIASFKNLSDLDWKNWAINKSEFINPRAWPS